ncbi:helix-turn-helix transcriptional regulator [Actinomadura livida]|uniref:DNA-binding CsgD family transcriptional regulator n=1 Tax=Actinomadura livida TaxID=79909 RepID=A0A7W7I7F0_9ACTN|nr:MULTISPECIES: helix-turn-helix transcriptional regulator [Actinomadura]MBB4771764.1 DNA-binding CsgD family transcriptional regulator [Actinomadura catellatispora]GGU02364.1 helix-turn-helix transcriptional regulator [Actinomadura livida]
MANAAVHARVRDDIVRLVHRGLPVPDFSRAVGDALGRAVPAEGTCLMTIDPATMLPTAEFVENGLPAAELLRLVEIEVREPDFNKWVQLSRADRPAASLSEVTAGDLDRSLRQREIRGPGGFADELRVVLAGGKATWGALTVFREANRPHFSAAEVRFASSLAGLIADGLRRGLLLDAARAGDADTGLLILDTDDGVQMSNQAAQRWLDELGTGDRAGAELPLVVPAVARQARALCDAPPTAVRAPAELRPARARARTRSGQWLIVRGSLMGDGPDSPVAVMLEAARPAEMAPLMADAYGFTDTERRVTELVAQGLSTRQIADRLQVSSYTVQDHLKSIFAKSGTGSRGDLVAQLFFDHYAAPLTLGTATPP